MDPPSKTRTVGEGGRECLSSSVASREQFLHLVPCAPMFKPYFLPGYCEGSTAVEFGLIMREKASDWYPGRQFFPEFRAGPHSRKNGFKQNSRSSLCDQNSSSFLLVGDSYSLFAVPVAVAAIAIISGLCFRPSQQPLYQRRSHFPSTRWTLRGAGTRQTNLESKRPDFAHSSLEMITLRDLITVWRERERLSSEKAP